MKYFIITISLYFCTVYAQNRNINNFKMITWNSDGPKWDSVINYFEQSQADVMCVQECGNIASSNVRPTNRITPTVYLGTTPTTESLTILEYEMQSNGRILYIYYYDRNTRTAAIEPNKSEVKKFAKSLKKKLKRLNNNKKVINRRPPIEDTTKQNMVIISREPAQQLFILPMIGSDQQFLTPEDSRYYINRPVIGIRIDDAVFFNVHAEPSDVNNEVVGIINQITDDMILRFPTVSWILMGDFNRDDDVLFLADFESNSPNIINRDLIRTLEPTRQLRQGQSGTSTLRRLDYAVARLPQGTNRLVASLLSTYFTNHRIRYVNGNSDHIPVIITVLQTTIG